MDVPAAAAMATPISPARFQQARGVFRYPAGTLDADEIEAVLAHELGHFRHHHVFKRIALMFAVSFAGLALLGWLSASNGSTPASA